MKEPTLSEYHTWIEQRLAEGATLHLFESEGVFDVYNNGECLSTLPIAYIPPTYWENTK